MSDKKISGMERRYIPAEMRVDQDGKIEGYAAVFGEWADLGYFKEKIRKGAFKNTIKDADVRALFNHDANQVLGRNTAGTLELSEDSKGLQFRVNPPATQWANDLQVSMKRGDIDQASFGFEAVKDEWDHNSEPIERELVEVRLFDVSVVTYPAYPQTSVSARSLADRFIATVGNTGNEKEIRYLLEKLDEILAIEEPGITNPHSETDLEAQENIQAWINVQLRKVELDQIK
jgi:HK97 family phage prohead protease